MGKPKQNFQPTQYYQTSYVAILLDGKCSFLFSFAFFLITREAKLFFFFSFYVFSDHLCFFPFEFLLNVDCQFSYELHIVDFCICKKIIFITVLQPIFPIVYDLQFFYFCLVFYLTKLEVLLNSIIFRWEGGSGWGTHVNPWLIHVNVWQKPICLQLIKIIGKKIN